MNHEEQHLERLRASDYDKEHLRKVVAQGWESVAKLARIVLPCHLHDFGRTPDDIGSALEHKILIDGPNYPHWLLRTLVSAWCDTSWQHIEPCSTAERNLVAAIAAPLRRTPARPRVEMRHLRAICDCQLGLMDDKALAQSLLGRSLEGAETVTFGRLHDRLPLEVRAASEDEVILLRKATEGEDHRKEAFFRMVATRITRSLESLDTAESEIRNEGSLDGMVAEELHCCLRAGTLSVVHRKTRNGWLYDMALIPVGLDSGNGFTIWPEESMAYALLAPATFHLLRIASPLNGQIALAGDITDSSMYFPAKYYTVNFDLSGDTLRQAARDSNAGHRIRTKKLNSRDNGYYYPDVQRRYPASVPPQPPSRPKSNS